MASPITLKRVLPGDVKALTLSPIDDVTLAQAGSIMKEVREGGEAKLREIAEKFGDVKAGMSTCLNHCVTPFQDYPGFC